MTNNYHPFLLHSVQQAIIRDGSREAVISWLVWNDGNGCYSDEDSKAEGYPPLTLNQARHLMEGILNDA